MEVWFGERKNLEFDETVLGRKKLFYFCDKNVFRFSVSNFPSKLLVLVSLEQVVENLPPTCKNFSQVVGIAVAVVDVVVVKTVISNNNSLTTFHFISFTVFSWLWLSNFLAAAKAASAAAGKNWSHCCVRSLAQVAWRGWRRERLKPWMGFINKFHLRCDGQVIAPADVIETSWWSHSDTISKIGTTSLSLSLSLSLAICTVQLFGENVKWHP